MTNLLITNSQRGYTTEVVKIQGLKLTGVQKAGFEAWIDALRNHGYSQTARRSRIGDLFDVYGVALDIMPEFGKWVKSENNLTYFLTPEGYWYGRLFPPAVKKALGMKEDVTAIVRIGPNRIEKSLGLLNDEGATFEQLATILEYHRGEGYEAKVGEAGNADS
jgi:hypothetical protein